MRQLKKTSFIGKKLKVKLLGRSTHNNMLAAKVSEILSQYFFTCPNDSELKPEVGLEALTYLNWFEWLSCLKFLYMSHWFTPGKMKDP